MIEIKRNTQKRPEMPVLASECKQPIKYKAEAQNASQGLAGRYRAFTAPTDPARDYRAMYAALFRFHERNNPPAIGREEYWAATTDDMQATAKQFNDDPFMMNLLCVVFEELECEYKAMRQA